MTSTNDILDRCELHIALKDAYVLIYDPEKSERVVRAAKYYGHNARSIERLIEDKSLVDDAEVLNGSKFLITFYGSKETAEQLLKADMNSDKRKKKVNSQSSASRFDDPTTSKDHSRSDQELTPQTRRTRQAISAPSSSNEISSTTMTTLRCVQSIERAVEKLQTEMKDLKSLFGEFLDSKDNFDNDSGPTKETTLARQACKIMKKCRKQGFERKLSSIDWDEIEQDPNKIVEIKNILTTQEWPSKMVAEIAEIIYGDILITHILGRNGKRDRKPRKGERQLTISRSEEDKLRTVLSVFGTCFTSDSAWQIMVQHYVNQRGRDMKNRKIREEKEKQDLQNRLKRGYDTDDEEDLDSPKKMKKDLVMDDDPKYDQETEGEHSNHSSENM